MRTKELLRGKQFGKQKGSVKKRMKNSSDMHIVDNNENDKVQIEDSNGDRGNLSRKARRKQRQAEYKLSDAWLQGYAKMISKPKRETKH